MLFSKFSFSVRLFNRGLNGKSVGLRSICTGKKPEEEKEKKDEGNKNVGSGKKGLVLGVYQTGKKFELSPVAQEVNQKCGDKIAQHLNTLSSELALGKAFALTDILPEYSAVALTSLGPKDASYNEMESLDEARENVRWAVGAGVKRLKRRGCTAIDVDPATAPDAAAEAAELAAWKFECFKSTSGDKSEIAVNLYGTEGKESWKEGAVRGRAQNWARFLSDMPANMMTPVDLAQAALDMLCPLGVRVEAHDLEWIRAQRMRAFLAVARGSCTPPLFLDCTYRGAGATTPPVLIAAKGVTFDSGGLCLKQCEAMIDNRGSMAGAAVALAALKTVAKLKLPMNISLVIPICENMVSGQCMKVGDVVQALNGTSIIVENTDMEGRLMMADALVYGQALYKPSLVIDVATFTMGVLMATGGGAFGCFSNSADAWKATRAAGARAGDRPWRFPLWHYYQKQIINDPSVDLRNKGSGTATPCLGAAFLKNFICGDWVHMDITGVGKVASVGAPPYLNPRRMTGRPARTLATLLHDIASASGAKAAENKEFGCAANP
ncbi:cytosol aminopeptidase [Helicoverpa armigera]|uniref:cytosol aminopeptidase n=1 Tax=Helicoverpa armigera TaxID=29058 RepID=UPI003082E879